MFPVSLILSIVAASLVMSGAAIALIVVRRAPEGFEDATGFHHVRGSEIRTDDVASEVASSGASLV